ncbi:MAG TPA: SIMPL domain-containing protein [Capillimicrobium sp.]|nr:SIMPL domain-containing protein [Capillimicrobium sp.]
MRPALALLAVLGVLAAPAAAPAQEPTTSSSPPTLAVVGQGSAFATPDTAELGAAVTKVARRAEPARADVARRMGDLLAALDRLGIARADVQTTSVSVDRGRHRKPPRVRYTARSSISIMVRDVAKVGPVLDALVAAGADDVDGPWFGFSSPSAGRAEAEQAALADARARADAIAAAVGMRVVGVRSIDLDPGASGGPVGDSAAASAPAASGKGGAPTPVEAGREQVFASVAVVYVLGPAA